MFVQNLENFVLNRLRKYIASIEFLLLKCKIIFKFSFKIYKFVQHSVNDFYEKRHSTYNL